MEAEFSKRDLFRPLQWRADRATALAEHRPTPLRPTSRDDRYVRAYRRLLLAESAAGDDELKSFGVFLEMPHICLAHRLRYWFDCDLRQTTEAWLLTGEPSIDLANRLETDEKTIDYYEKLFFDIRDRLHHKDWIATVILDPYYQLLPAKNGRMSDAQKWFMYRLFGYYGGPLLLEAILAGAAPDVLPCNSVEVPKWFDEVLANVLRFGSPAAVKNLATNRHDVIQQLEKAIYVPKTPNAAKRGAAMSRAHVDK